MYERKVRLLIDGVFSGGGLKGFALVGAYAALEDKGYQFQRVAGTSAGSILASFIAAGYTAKEIEQLLDELDVAEFLDPRKLMFPIPFMKWIQFYWRLGIYQGKALEQWIFDKLAQKGIYSFADLPHGTLKLIASDLTNGKMMVLPDDLSSYGISPESFPVARAVRMSCSIPFFFEPIKMKVGKEDTIIVDGGVLSNFPMWLFQDDKEQKKRPIIGLKLSASKDEAGEFKINHALHLFEALFSTMKNAHDDRYISRAHEKDVVFIPVEHANITKFHMEDDMKEEMMQIGRTRTEQFLRFW